MQWLNIHEGVRPRMFHTSCLLGYSTNITNFSVISFLCHFTNSQPITIMPAKPKTAHSNETISVILAIHSAGKSHGKIAD